MTVIVKRVFSKIEISEKFQKRKQESCMVKKSGYKNKIKEGIVDKLPIWSILGAVIIGFLDF